MKKLTVFIKLYWVRILLIFLASLFVFVLLALLLQGFTNFQSLESFSKKQHMSNMGMYLIIGIFQAVFFTTFLLVGQHYILQGGGLGNIGKEKLAKAVVNVHWNEVIGMEGAKRDAQELVKLLKDRSLLKVIGGKIVKGTMMLGPPGCGKTYLAKAIATECGLPMLTASGSDFVGIIIGQGAAQVKSLFKQARAMAQMEGGCLIFIDEIDSFARPRQQEHGFGGATSHNATINQFLTELDGLRQLENNIVVIAATNAGEDELDSAIMRAGRFDRKIYVTKPNLDERKELFKFYLSRVKAEASVECDMLARKALGFSPSDIDSMVREAGLIALRSGRDTLNAKDLNEAYERVVFGLRSNINLTKEEKIWTAYHEAGHAVIAYLTHPTNDVIKASIIPRKGALGFIYQRSVEELHSSNKEHLLANIKVNVASYVAEEMKFGTTSSGVSGDFNTAMKIAHMMVWRLGMGKSGLIGDFYSTADAQGQPMVAEKTKEVLDNDVQDILQSCTREVRSILQERRELLEHFAQELIKKEELEYDEIVNIFDSFGLQAASRPAAQSEEMPKQG